MLHKLKKSGLLKRIQRTMTYSRLRQYLPMSQTEYIDDLDKLEAAEVIKIDWPENVDKPRVGIVRDPGKYPRWTKYRRFLEKNSFPFSLFDIHSHDWIEKAKSMDVIVGVVSSAWSRLEEIQKKYFFLETCLGKKCFPSTAHALLYENKCLEAYLSELFEFPFAKTYVSYNKEDALALVDNLNYPLVSKVVPCSAGTGVQLLRTPRQARRVVEQAFSRRGRKVHVHYFRQKDYVYLQEFIPNDGYDIRVIMVGNCAFGYYRKVLRGDFRGSGMNLWEKRALPEEAVRTAWRVNKCIGSPLLAVDMVRGLDGTYSIIEFSPLFLWETPEQLMVDGVPGVYMIGEDGQIRFEKGRYWVDELALREFFRHHYLTRALAK